MPVCLSACMYICVCMYVCRHRVRRSRFLAVAVVLKSSHGYIIWTFCVASLGWPSLATAHKLLCRRQRCRLRPLSQWHHSVRPHVITYHVTRYAGCDFALVICIARFASYPYHCLLSCACRRCYFAPSANRSCDLASPYPGPGFWDDARSAKPESEGGFIAAEPQASSAQVHSGGDPSSNLGTVIARRRRSCVQQPELDPEVESMSSSRRSLPGVNAVSSGRSGARSSATAKMSQPDEFGISHRTQLFVRASLELALSFGSFSIKTQDLQHALQSLSRLV